MTIHCPIPNAQGFCQPEGLCTNGVMVLLEALGEEEVKDGGLPARPQAPAGSVLERAIRRAGFQREQFVLWNTVPVQPPHNYLEGAPYEAEAIAWGLPYIQEMIARFHPSVILALGNVALGACCGLRNVMLNRGYPRMSRFGIPVIGSLHPSFLRRGAIAYMGVLMHDLRFAVALAAAERLAGHETPSKADGASAASMNPGSGSPLVNPVADERRAHIGPKRGHRPVKFYSPILWREVEYPHVIAPDEPIAPPGYVLYPTEHDAQAFLDELREDETRLLAYDIETPYSHATKEDESDELEDQEILSAQFSLASETGIFLPWRPPFIEAIREILASPNPKLGANNWRFDDPRLEAHGCRIAGQRYDLRWAFKHFQPDLSGALQFIASFYCPEIAPWKHLSHSHPQIYGIRDVDVLMRIV